MNTLQQYGYHALFMFIRSQRIKFLGGLAVCLAGVACGGAESQPPVARRNLHVAGNRQFILLMFGSRTPHPELRHAPATPCYGSRRADGTGETGEPDVTNFKNLDRLAWRGRFFAHLDVNRQRFLPTIALLREWLDVVEVDGGVDYRLRMLAALPAYFVPADAAAERAMNDAFDRLAGAADEDPVLSIDTRRIVARRRAGSAVWFDFGTLCDGPRSQRDYLEIAQRFSVVLVSGVPRMNADGADRASSIDAALELAAESDPDWIWVIGGGELFAALIDRAHRLEVTELDLVVPDGDAFAPPVGPEWRETAVDPSDGWHTSRTGIRHRFRRLER